MAREGFKRKLAAILIADVVGYSRLMEEEDMKTVRNLRKCQEVIAGYILQNRGRVVDSPGDSLLAEFKSVVDAVQCAVEIQRELAGRNDEISNDRKMEYRIGVNLGDVIQKGKRIYGDGINVAARLEALAEPGGIDFKNPVSLKTFGNKQTTGPFIILNTVRRLQTSGNNCFHAIRGNPIYFPYEWGGSRNVQISLVICRDIVGNKKPSIWVSGKSWLHAFEIYAANHTVSCVNDIQ